MPSIPPLWVSRADRYERFGICLDGNWLQRDLKRKTGPCGYAGAALDSGTGIPDYGVMYRFTGGIRGSLGYRATVFEVPTAIEPGYKALKLDMSEKSVDTNALMSGPFLGATAFW